MSVDSFLLLWVSVCAPMLFCRVAPAFLLRGRALSPRVTEALGYIPPAAFAALAANDLLTPGMFAAGLWPAAAPLVAAAVVAVVACKTKSMLCCCVVGVLAHLLLTLV